MRSYIDNLAFAFSLCAVACGASAEDCKTIADDAARLKCYDTAAGRIALPSPQTSDKAGDAPLRVDGSDKAPWWASFQLRSQGTLSKPGPDPAILSFARNKGSDSSLIQAAILWKAPVLGTTGAQPFLSYSINRDSLTTPKTDVRDAQAGIAYTFGYGDVSPAITSTLTAGERTDHIQHQSSAIVTLQTAILIPALYKTTILSAASKPITPYQIFPLFGFFYQNKQVVPQGSQTGHRDGPYIGVQGSINPGAYIPAIGDRFSINASFQSYWDINAAASVGKATLHYWTVSLAYLLTNDSSWIKPYLFIERDVGSDPISGSFSVNRTLVGLKASIN